MNVMKKIRKRAAAAALGAAVAMVAFPSYAADAAPEKITVNLNGTEMNFDVEPIIENGRTLVPFRAIFEALGCSVTYKNEGGVGYVSAFRGDEYIGLTIGSDKMNIGGEEKTLDVAPKITDGRTLVPLRAVSEGLGCDVEWFGDIRTAAIHAPEGQYKISSGHIEKTVKSSDGAELICISASYPIINPDVNDAFSDKINTEYREKAEKYVAAFQESNKEDAEMLRSAMGAENYRPVEAMLSYKINTNRMNLVSITTYDYENLGGAHPNELCESRTFNMEEKRELTLNEVLKSTAEETDKIVYNEFCACLENAYKENGTGLTDEDRKKIDEQKKNVRWYINDNAIVLYFNQYDIAPYAFGRPKAELPVNDETKDKYGVDLSGANLDKLEFELEGNPTTGFTWEVVNADSDKLDVKSEYVPDAAEKNMAGVGGKYKFTVTGLKEGNATLECSYMRTFEGESSSLKTVGYKVLVTKDKKITVLDKYEKTAEELNPVREITAAEKDMITLKDGEKYLTGEALVFGKDAKKLSGSDLKAGDRVLALSKGDNLVIIRSANASAEGFREITKVDDGIITLDGKDMYITGEADIYDESAAEKNAAFSVGESVLVLSSGDTLVIIKK